MLFPTTCVDNFFKNHSEVVRFAKKQKYTPDPNHLWPGERSESLAKTDPKFAEYFGNKVLSLLYPIQYKQINFDLDLTFQKISKQNKNKGWVHKDDPMELTTIVYLSNHKNCGTKIYKPINHAPILDNQKNKQLKSIRDLNNNNKLFEETIDFKSRYNRLIMFDSSQWHAASCFYEENIEEERLTLIGFFKLITAPGLKYPCVENGRI